jgi:hypothetical protein
MPSRAATRKDLIDISHEAFEHWHAGFRKLSETGFGFHLQTGFRIDDRGVQGDMSEPGTNRVAIYTRSEQNVSPSCA